MENQNHWEEIYFRYVGELFSESIPSLDGAAWIQGENWFELDTSKIDFESSSVSFREIDKRIRIDVTAYVATDDSAGMTTTDLAQIAYVIQKSLDRSQAQIAMDQRDMIRFARTVHPNYPYETFRQTGDISRDWIVEGLLDNRPFRYHADRFEEFQRFPNFHHWDDICIEIVLEAPIDLAFGSSETKEIIYFETYEEFSRVNIKKVDPALYLERLENNYYE
jgi:hypothetical protein